MAECPAKFESGCRLKLLRADFNPQHAWALSPLVSVTASIEKTNSEHYQLTSPASISSEKNQVNMHLLLGGGRAEPVSQTSDDLCVSLLSHYLWQGLNAVFRADQCPLPL